MTTVSLPVGNRLRVKRLIILSLPACVFLCLLVLLVLSVRQAEIQVLKWKLTDAATTGDLSGARYALDHGCPPDATSWPINDTPLVTAIICKHFEIAHLLLDRGASVDPHTAHDISSPLIDAVLSGDRSLVIHLIRRGANVRRELGYGQTPLYMAAAMGDVETAKLLLAAGAPVDGGSKFPGMPLRGAAEKGRHDMALLLLAHGARVDLKSHKGLTARDIARSKGFARVADLLKHAATLPR